MNDDLPDALRNLADQFGESLPAPTHDVTLDGVKDFVRSHVERLLDGHPALLMSILYRIDVPERDVRRVLDDAPYAEIASQLTDLIIVRQLEKVRMRRRYRSK